MNSETEEERVSVQVKTRPEKPYVSDFQIDTDLEIMFPDEYISNISERIRLYKELNEIDSDEALILFRNRSLLTDSEISLLLQKPCWIL